MLQILAFDATGIRMVGKTLETIPTQPDQILWIDVHEPTPDLMYRLQERCSFHPLAVEDTLNQRQRPKVEEYNDHVFIIGNAASLKAGTLDFDEIDLFLGRNYIVTVHNACPHIIQEVQQRIERKTNFKHISTDYLLYMLLDALTDGYFPLLDQLDAEVEQLSETIIRKPSPKSLERLIQIKRMLNEMWHVVEQQQNMFSTLTRREDDLITHHDVLQYYLRDVHDHLIRISGITHMLRENITSLIELYMSSESYRLNVVVNRLTVVTITIGIFTVISGFYGMNFEVTYPPFKTEAGVPFVLVLMFGLAGLTLYLFKRMRWF